jgi:hypothetical protein
VELFIGPGDFVNAGAMLRGIKARAERARVEVYGASASRSEGANAF